MESLSAQLPWALLRHLGLSALTNLFFVVENKLGFKTHLLAASIVVFILSRG